MALHQFTTTGIEEAAITDARRDENAERSRQVPPQPPFDDNASFVEFVVRARVLGPKVMSFVNKRLQLVADAYRTATPAQRQAVDSALGL